MNLPDLLPVSADLSFQWPRMLWLLAILPLAALYPRLQSRRRLELDRRLAALGFADSGRTRTLWSTIGQQMPVLLMFVAIAVLILAVSRPQVSLVLPAHDRTIVLAIDISGSMRAADLKPDRISAARDAAKAFIEMQPADAKIGLVSVAASATVAQSPTKKREELIAAIDRLQLQRGTAVGSGIVIALAALLPEAAIDVEKHINGYSTRWFSLEEDSAKPVPPGSNRAAAIVLMTDGQTNMGPDPLKMARLAADHGVRIHAVGIGTPEGATLSMKGMSMRVRLDETALKRITELTLGDYFSASNASDLTAVYRKLSAQLSFEKKRPVEVSGILAGIAALLAMVAAFTTLYRDGRVF